MPYAGPGGLPPSMGQYSQYGAPSQTPSYAPYMNPQAPYFNPSSYGGYHQGSNAYGSGATAGFSGNSAYQHGAHPKYPGYSNQGKPYMTHATIPCLSRVQGQSVAGLGLYSH